MRLPYRLPWRDQRPNGISTFRTAGPIHTSQHRSVVVPRVRGGPVAVWVPEVSCLCPGMREAPGVLWGCVGLGRECFGYAKAPWGVCSEGLPVRVVRRRATLPHPVGCSTIAVPGLSFRVRNGTGRLTWAMAAANLLLYGQTLGSAGLWRPGNRTADADMSMFRLVARQCSLPSGVVCRRKMRSPKESGNVSVAFRPLVPVGSTPRGASTSGLSTTCSAWGLQELEGSTECLSWSRLPA